MGQGGIDFDRFRDSLIKAGYQDWLIIEGSKPNNLEIVPAYKKNARFLDTTFRS